MYRTKFDWDSKDTSRQGVIFPHELVAELFRLGAERRAQKRGWSMSDMLREAAVLLLEQENEKELEDGVKQKRKELEYLKS